MRRGRDPRGSAAAIATARLILETEFETDDGAVRVIDCMPLRDRAIRTWCASSRACGARVRMRMELIIRFDYGSIVPWVRQHRRHALATAGPDTLELHTAVDVHGENMTTVAEFDVAEGERGRSA